MKQLLTHSRMQSFKSCRKKHWWEYEVGFRKEVDQKALRMGTAGHSGLDSLKQGHPLEDALLDVRVHYQAWSAGLDEVDLDIERETVECLVTGYSWRWGEVTMKVVDTERVFRLPLVNPATDAFSQIWDVAGKIDGVVKLEDGRLAVIEHKFISDPLDLDGDYWRRLQLDPQISMYVYAARKLGYDVETVLYDVVRKPTIRPEKVPILDNDGCKVVIDQAGLRVMTKQGKPRQTGDVELGYTLQSRPQSTAEWSEKLLADIANRPDFYFARVEIARLDNDIDELLEENWDIQKTLRDAQSRGRWYKTVTQGTCPYCAFFGLCSSRYDPSDGIPPDGFVKLTEIHPELEELVP